jgi:tetratricopeptide (TPR) repeat protein
MSYAPSHLRALFEQASRCRKAGYEAELGRLCREILQRAPASGEDFYYHGCALMWMGRVADALASFDNALAVGPITPELLVDRGVLLAELRRLDEAVASCEWALTLRPGFARAHFVRAGYLRTLARLDEALESFNSVLAISPDFIQGLVARAAILTDLKQYKEALADYDRLLQLRPGDSELLTNRGHVLGELLRFEEALQSLEKALAINPNYVKALHDRGVVLWTLERFEEALASYDRALAISFNPITLSNRANTLQDLMRADEALATHERVIATWPDFAAGHWNRSQDLLLQGNWKEGLLAFEWRKKRPEFAGHYLASSHAEWLGQEDLAGKTLFVRAEQGLGDSLQFCRYLALAQAEGAKVIFSVQDVLVRLMASLEPEVEIVSFQNTPPHFDHHIAMMSLPLALGSTKNNVPADIPYLKAEPDRVALWRDRLGNDGFKIGVSWRGGGLGNVDRGRSFPVGMLMGLAQLGGVRLISLQKGLPALEQLTHLPPGLRLETLENFDEGPDAFIDSAAVMENLDLVISSDTAVAHLAGALGRPTWLALKRVPEWRWGLADRHTPWYPSMRLFRQQAVGAWDGVFAEMESELKMLLARA